MSLIFFVNIASNLKEPIPDSDFINVKNFVNANVPNLMNFNIPLITESETRKMLTNLDVSKATGLDQIGPKLLKLSADVISSSITHIINCSISQGVFPDQWKSAKVNPLFKKGLANDVNNYRPISILPTLSKLIEKHVHDSFITYLNHYKLLCKSQSGFRKKHSCETALVHMIDNWLKSLNNGEIVGVVMLDFSKAFDLCSHDILLKKLKIYKCSNITIKWFESYLTNRTQSVSVNGVISDKQITTCGVPQGSILGPLLFLLFINHLPLYVQENDSNVDMYADDTTIYDINLSKTVVERNLQRALNNVSNWCLDNGMVLNAAKTKVLLITTPQKRSQLVNKNLSLHYKDVNLEITAGDKILGVYINEKLKWDNHITFVRKKISTNLWLLSRIKLFLPLHYRILFYKAYIQPHLDFCNIIWGSTNKSNIQILIRLQRRACHIILGEQYTNLNEALLSINVLSIEQRILLQKAKFMYRVFQNATPSYIQNMFQYNNNNHRNLRSSNHLNVLIPKPNKELFKGSMSYSGAKVWNSIPDYIRLCPTINSFTSNFIKWIKSG